MSKRRRIVLVIAIVVAIFLGSSVAYYKWKFPYGGSHCCIKIMSFALERYAEENGGKFPTGEASPEASLSLLNKSGYIGPSCGPNILRGMTVPEKTVRRILEGGGLLGPDSCGWNYVPGLTRSDNPRLALLWCKTALGHDGQRTGDGGREVVFVGRGIEWISGSKWPAFLQEQQELLKHRSANAIAGRPLVTWTIELPDGSRTDRVDGSYTMKEKWKGPGSSGSGTSSGMGLGPSQLVWFQAPLENSSVTRTLSFSNLVSDPVTVTFVNGVPDVTNAVITMRRKP